MTVRINKQKINLREKLAETEEKVNFDQVVRGLGEYSGNVGIGTTSPSAGLEIKSHSEPLAIYDTNDEKKLRVFTAANGAVLGLTDGGSDIIRLDGRTTSPNASFFNAGNVGIGTTSPISDLHLHSATTGVGPIMQLSNDTGDCRLFFGTNSTTGNANAAGQIRYNVTNDHLTFYSSLNERMRIDSAGNVGIGTSSPTTIVSATTATTATNGFAFVKNLGYGTFASNSSGPGLYINKTNVSTSQSTDYINFRNKGAKVGGIEYDGTDVELVQTSDARLKENIQDSESGLSLVNNLKVRSFDWVESKRKSKKFGFVAQEMHEVFEDAVKAGGEDENEDPWGIYDSKLIPVLTKAIQEQQQLIDDLKSRIKTLEQQ